VENKNIYSNLTEKKGVAGWVVKKVEEKEKEGGGGKLSKSAWARNISLFKLSARL